MVRSRKSPGSQSLLCHRHVRILKVGEKILNERLDIMYGKYIMTPETREADFKQELIIDRYGTIEYYKNELETHKAERENFPEVSHYYENERTWLEWTYEQLLIIATEQSSNK